MFKDVGMEKSDALLHHLLVEHQFVIADVELIADFKRYVTSYCNMSFKINCNYNCHWSGIYRCTLSPTFFEKLTSFTKIAKMLPSENSGLKLNSLNCS